MPAWPGTSGPLKAIRPDITHSTRWLGIAAHGTACLPEGPSPAAFNLEQTSSSPAALKLMVHLGSSARMSSPKQISPASHQGYLEERGLVARERNSLGRCREVPPSSLPSAMRLWGP